MPEPRITVGADVRRHLSDEDITALRHGLLVPTRFNCGVCGQTGDARLDPANAVLWTGRIGDRPAQFLALAHAGCAKSQVRRGALGRPGWRRTP